MYSIFNKILFAIDPENAHDFTIGLLTILGEILGPSNPISGRSVNIGGLSFENPVGLAAGLDKNGEAVSGLSRLGFGHIEVGTVTPRAQPGNPKPRLFRVIEDEGLINRLGFNNSGIDALVKKLDGHPFKGVLGVNIGKNKETTNKLAVSDYLLCVEKAASVCDYITVNLSSPNTPGLRDLASANNIVDTVKPIVDRGSGLRNRRGSNLPIFVKLAPDFDDDSLLYVLEALISVGIDAVVLTNTTVCRANLYGQNRKESGGLSGAPLASKSEHCLKIASKFLDGRIPIVSVGGIMTADCCRQRLATGASLVQVYSGLIYRGPSLIKKAISITK